MLAFIPQGFRLVAVTELPGTAATVKAYIHPERNQIYIRAVYTIVNTDREGEERELNLGPIPRQVLPAINHVLQDVSEMRSLTFLEE